MTTQISAAINPRGEMLAKHDHYRSGPGYVVADVPIRKRVTLFAKFGHWPMLGMAGVIIAGCFISTRKQL